MTRFGTPQAKRDQVSSNDKVIGTHRLAGRGIPRDQRASYQAVVEEQWAGEPPQVTQQALRMAADGLSRDTVLDKLVQDH